MREFSIQRLEAVQGGSEALRIDTLQGIIEFGDEEVLFEWFS